MPHILLCVQKQMWTNICPLKDPALTHQTPSSRLKTYVYIDISVACTPPKGSRHS